MRIMEEVQDNVVCGIKCDLKGGCMFRVRWAIEIRKINRERKDQWRQGKGMG